MILTLEIPQPLDAKLTEKAKAAGLDVTTYAQCVLKADALLSSLDESLAPVRQAFIHSGATEDQAVDEYEAEKHAIRATRQGKPFCE